ncbi:MAG: phage antirepressor KilAC domain-containing protein [Peptoanaerobacter stomatis]|uniref:phage antirepressor KilAC domain-containing protein n=1 Tax=Peptoanaerobacter stomatis TaxID=796937 RepID=UPI003FA14921
MCQKCLTFLHARYLNDLLHKLKIQFKQGGLWLLYDKYAKHGYTQSTTVKIKHSDGSDGSRVHTKWTQKGRLFLYNLLKNENILPLAEI